MKNETLIALKEIDEIPKVLLESWMATKKEDPCLEARDVVTTKRFSEALFYCGITLVVSMLFAAILLQQYFPKGPEGVSVPVMFFVFIAGAGVIFSVLGACLTLKKRESEFGKTLTEFTNIMGLNYGQLAALSLEEWKKKADDMLFSKAFLVKEDQVNGSQNLSESAERTRAKFKRVHTLFREFRLADKTWDRYFKDRVEEKGETVAATT